MAVDQTYDVAVIGAGVFGAWTAHFLASKGQRVVLLDAYGPSNSRASSGGESRIIRMGYGADEIYTRWSMAALPLWKELFARTRNPLFHRTGVLWICHPTDRYTIDTIAVFERSKVRFEKLSHSELVGRYPQIAFDTENTGILEPDSGVLMARRAVQLVVEDAANLGVYYQASAVQAPQGSRRLGAVKTQNGSAVKAGTFIFACGPWLPKIFPDLLGGRIFPTRQEVFFFGVPAGDQRFSPSALPTWINLPDEYYGMPDLESRGVKLAFDRHGAEVDPDTQSRIPSAEAISSAKQYLARHFPALKDAPVVETRVCQYENTSNGDFLIDRHPEFDNVWLVGGGSGHGFKHGPSVGEYVTAQVMGSGKAEPRFSLATKQTMQKRAVY